MNEELAFDKQGFDLTMMSEYLKLEAYPDPATGSNPYTIGYGHTGSEVYPGMRITEGVALSFLVDDIIKCEDAIKFLVKAPLTQGQFDALVDFTFNLGVYNLANSTLLKLINQGRMKEADQEFYKWDKAGGKVLQGLVKRRAAEAALFNV